MKIILTAIGSKYIHTALGLRSIRAYAKAHGIEAELIEDTVQTPLLAVLAEINGKEPDVVGLSEHSARPGVHIRAGHGRKGRGTRDDHLASGILRVGHLVPLRQQNGSAA